VEISTELALDEARIAVSSTPSVCEEGLQVLADDCVQDGGLGLTPAIRARKWSRCGAPRPLEGSRRRRRGPVGATVAGGPSPRSSRARRHGLRSSRIWSARKDCGHKLVRMKPGCGALFP